MELQVPHSICTEISEKSTSPRETCGEVKILRELCDWKGIKIIEAEICPDHVHMFVEIPPKMIVSSFMGYLKGKSSVIFHERHGNLKFKYGNRSFWCGTMWIRLAKMQSE